MFAALWVFVVLSGWSARAEDLSEDDYYPITRIPVPEGVVLEAGSLEVLPDGRLAASSRRGDVYLIENAMAGASGEPRFTRFAGGLHEVLGLSWREGALYATQRGEITRLADSDGDGRADVFDCVNSDWGINGDYHEYAFGSRHDREGNLWVVLCLTGSGAARSDFRGWCLRVTPDGRLLPTCSGIRSPGGVGENHLGDMFYTDNQGPWNGSSALMHLKPGGFMGNPTGNVYYTMECYTYIYQSSYGSPVVDHTRPSVKSVALGGDGKSARLVVDGLVKGNVHELQLPGVRAKDGRPLLHPVAYYTLNEIPAE